MATVENTHATLRKYDTNEKDIAYNSPIGFYGNTPLPLPWEIYYTLSTSVWIFGMPQEDIPLFFQKKSSIQVSAIINVILDLRPYLGLERLFLSEVVVK